MTIDPTTVVSSTKHVYARDFDGELVLLDLAKGSYYGLDALGARVWNALMVGRTVADIVAEVAPEYEVERDVLERDLVDLVRDLAEKGLVETRTT